MECKVNGSTLKNAITKTIEKELLRSAFIRQGERYVTTETVGAQDFVNGINRAYGQVVVRRVTDGAYEISIPDSLVRDYFIETKDGKEVIKIVNLLNNIYIEEDSWNKGEMFASLNYAEISPMTNEQLKSFLTSLNPDFKIEEIDNLSVEAVSYVKDFLIRVRTLSRFQAMPEEVAHVFRMMLPDTNPLKKDMYDNITSFNIYSKTLEAYKDVYTKDDGSPDYEKIRWEAADKLVAEYVTALSTGDKSRLQVLTKPKQNFIQRWFYAFIKFLGIEMLNKTQSYADMAALILRGEFDGSLKTAKEIEDISYTDSYFFRASEMDAYERANTIMNSAPSDLFEIANNLSKEFSTLFHKILTDKDYAHLNEILSEDLMTKEDGTVVKINKLTDIKTLFDEAKVDLKAAINTDTYVKGIKQFIEAVERLQLVTDAILDVLENKKDSQDLKEALSNIKELQVYFGIYETFKNMITEELANTLIEAKVGRDIVSSILDTQKNFELVNRSILQLQRKELFTFYKSLLSDSNKNAFDILQADMDREKGKAKPNPDIIKLINKQMEDLIVGDEKITNMLAGKGKDVDALSAINHFFNAAILNKDPFIAGIAKYIQERVDAKHQLAKNVIFDLNAKIDKIQKKLKETSEATGKAISYVEKIYDRATGKVREVLAWLNPHKDIQPDLQKLKMAVQEAQEKYDAAKGHIVEEVAAKEELKIVKKEYTDFLEKYMNRPFVREYYNFYKKYEENPLFEDAMREYRLYSEDIKLAELGLTVDPEDEELWTELSMDRRRRANLLSEDDLMGDPKNDLDKQKARILKEFFDESSKFRELDAVQTERTYRISENKYKQSLGFAIEETQKANPTSIQQVEELLRIHLKDKRLRIETLYSLIPNKKKGIDYDVIENLLMERWEQKNRIVSRNEKFEEDEAKLRTRLEELQKKGELDEDEQLIFEAYSTIRSILQGSRDYYGEINPLSLTEEQREKVVDLEDLIIDLRKKKPGMGVDLDEMSDSDRQTYMDQQAIIDDPSYGTLAKRKALSKQRAILKKYKDQGKSKEIRDLINMLGSLTERRPTQYYWDKMTEMIDSMSEFARHTIEDLELNPQDTPDELRELREFEQNFTLYIDDQDAEMLDFELYESQHFKHFLDFLKKYNPSQYRWFKSYHTEKSVFDHFNNKYTHIKNARSTLYDVKTPMREEHQKEEYLKKYHKTRVKDEYRTGYNPATGKVELQVGVHISNKETANGFPEFLPLLPEQGEPADSPYRNHAYYKMKDEADKNSKNYSEKSALQFEYLELLKQAHLQHQEKVPPRLRSWMLVPVTRLSEIEEVKHIPALLKEKYRSIKSFLSKGESVDSAEAALSGIDTIKEADQITYENINDKILKLGMSQKVPIDNVSRDLLKATMTYIIRSFEFEGRSEADPVVKTLVEISKQNLKSYKNKNNKEMARIFESIYNQMILQEVPDTNINNKQMRRIARFLTGVTSLRMVADPVGGLINYGSAMVNDVIEAAAGKHLNFQELSRGKLLAGRMNASLMKDFNKKADLSYYTLLYLQFDLVQGDFEEDMLDRSSSTDKWASTQQLLMIPRKAGELMAQSAIGLGMMERTKVFNSIDEKSYPVHEIYRVQDGKMVLKDGFPQEWNPVDGEAFLKFKQKINRVNLSLHGNYAKISQTEASRYALGKLAENMRRWFAPAIERRFGREAVDIMFEEPNQGYYNTTFQLLKNYFSNIVRLDFGGARAWSSYFWQTPRYRQNLQRMGADIGQAFLLYLAFAIVLGYSGDDKSKELDTNSWIHNTSILILLRVYSETTAYIPIPPWGFQEMKRNLTTPFSLPADAVSNFFAIGQLGMYHLLYWMGNENFEKDLHYQRDSGFWYSEKGDEKILKYILRTAGHTGYTFQPAPYIKAFDNLQNRLK